MEAADVLQVLRAASVIERRQDGRDLDEPIRPDA
jgi:hypothetical protein